MIKYQNITVRRGKEVDFMLSTFHLLIVPTASSVPVLVQMNIANVNTSLKYSRDRQGHLSPHKTRTTASFG
jgi:hypothetical protein